MSRFLVSTTHRNLPLSLLLCDRYGLNCISFKGWILFWVTKGNILDHIHSFDDLTENCVPTIQLWSRDKCDEELAAVCIAPSICHGDNAFFVKRQIAVFIFKLITGAAPASAGWVAALRHEPFQHAMKGHAFEISLTGEENKAVHSLWRFIWIKLNDKLPTGHHPHIGKILFGQINIQRRLAILRRHRYIFKAFTGSRVTKIQVRLILWLVFRREVPYSRNDEQNYHSQADDLNIPLSLPGFQNLLTPFDLLFTCHINFLLWNNFTQSSIHILCQRVRYLVE